MPCVACTYMPNASWRRRGGKAQRGGVSPMLGEEAEGWNGKHERSEGLHKRSAEDCGTPLAPRQGGALSEVWFPYVCASAHRTLGVSVASRNGLAEEGGGRRVSGCRQVRRDSSLHSINFLFFGMNFARAITKLAGMTVPLPFAVVCPMMELERLRAVLGCGNPFKPRVLYSARRFPTPLRSGSL
jgi:hypothetical protein